MVQKFIKFTKIVTCIRTWGEVMEHWTEDELSTSNLGDKRLDKRYKEVLTKMSINVEKSIPGTFDSHAELIATYRFINNERTKSKNLLEPHLRSTKLRLSTDQVVLSVQDTTSIDFTRKKSSENLGHLESSKRRGLLVHQTLAITPERICKGIISSEIWTRDITKLGKRNKRKSIPIEEKESYRWLKSQQATEVLARDLPDKHFICVGDRENDIYEAFVENLSTPSNMDILIRCSYNRRLSSEESHVKLIDSIGVKPILGKLKVELKGRPGKKNRVAILEVRQVKRKLKAPFRKDRILPDIDMTLVQAKEINPPSDRDSIEWNLLTSMAVKDLSDAVTIIQYYKCRWEIEVYFKILKSGCRVQDLQLETASRLKTALTLYMILAWRIQYIMMLTRQLPNILANEVFSEIEIEAIYVLYKKKVPKKTPKLKIVATMLAQQGGYLNRKNDPPPGPKAFWVGFSKLSTTIMTIINLRCCV